MSSWVLSISVCVVWVAGMCLSAVSDQYPQMSGIVRPYSPYCSEWLRSQWCLLGCYSSHNDLLLRRAVVSSLSTTGTKYRYATFIACGPYHSKQCSTLFIYSSSSKGQLSKWLHFSKFAKTTYTDSGVDLRKCRWMNGWVGRSKSGLVRGFGLCFATRTRQGS